MSDNLTIFGTDYTNVAGIKAKGTGNGTLTYIRPQGTKSISANGTGIDVTGYAAVDVDVPTGTPSLQSKTATPTTSQQTISPDSGYDGLSSVTVNAMPTGTAGTPTATKVVDATDASALITPSVTNTAGYISGGTKTGTPFYVTAGELVSGNTLTADDSGNWDVTELETLVIPAGTEGTPTATKGTVSNHAVSVTPSVTNSAGYISGGTKTGTAVTVTAAELVSGTLTADDSGDWDVTNAETFNVPAGTAGTPTATKGTVSNNAVSVTPSVTNTTGYITGGTKTGTAVTVSASELVSGSETKTANGTYDVTNLASINVALDFVTYYTSSSDPTSSQGSNGDVWLVTS